MLTRPKCVYVCMEPILNPMYVCIESMHVLVYVCIEPIYVPMYVWSPYLIHMCVCVYANQT